MKERPDLFNLNGNLTVGKFKNETPANVITEFFHIWAKSYYYVLADKSTQSKYKKISKKEMNEMAENTYPKSESLMTQIYQDCLFNKKVFYAKNICILSLVESEKKSYVS